MTKPAHQLGTAGVLRAKKKEKEKEESEEKGWLPFESIEANEETEIFHKKLPSKKFRYVEFEPEIAMKITGGGIKYAPEEHRDLAHYLREEIGPENPTLADLIENKTNDLFSQILILNDVPWDDFEVAPPEAEVTSKRKGGESEGVEIKIGVSLTHKKTGLKAKLEFKPLEWDAKEGSWDACKIEGGLEKEVKLVEDVPLGHGLVWVTPAFKVELGCGIEPDWTDIAEELAKWAGEAIGSDAALAGLEAVTAVAVIYLASKGVQKFLEERSASNALGHLVEQVPAIEDEICRGFLEGVKVPGVKQGSHQAPEKSPFGAGFQLGLRSRADVVADMRAATEARVGQYYDEQTLDEKVVAETSKPEVQQRLLDKVKASGMVHSVARCIVFAGWAETFAGEPYSMKATAWSNLFKDRGDTRARNLIEQRTLLKAIGEHDYRAYESKTLPDPDKVGDVTL